MSGGEWHGDTYTSEDGREFAIFSEQIRGEPRFYEARVKIGREWRLLNDGRDGGTDKRTQRRRIERASDG